MPHGFVIALATTLLIASDPRNPGRVKLEEARSLVAEAAQVERLAAAGKLTSAYAEAIRGDLRKGLVSLQKEPALTADVTAALDAMDRRDGDGLQAIAARLNAQERALGRAG
jgi:hypothetical protein